MRKLTQLLIALSLSSLIAEAQTKDSLRVSINYGPNDSDLHLYMRVNTIDLYKFKIINDSKKNAKISIKRREFYDGIVTREVNEMNWKENAVLDLKASDSLSFSTITSHIQKDSIRINFDFPNSTYLGYVRKLPSDQYLLRDALDSRGEYKKVAFNNETPLLAYTMPYQDKTNPNIWRYCPQ